MTRESGSQHAVLRFPVRWHPVLLELVQSPQSRIHRSGNGYGLSGVDHHRHRAAAAGGRAGPIPAERRQVSRQQVNDAFWGASEPHTERSNAGVGFQYWAQRIDPDAERACEEVDRPFFCSPAQNDLSWEGVKRLFFFRNLSYISKKNPPDEYMRQICLMYSLQSFSGWAGNFCIGFKNNMLIPDSPNFDSLARLLPE